MAGLKATIGAGAHSDTARQRAMQAKDRETQPSGGKSRAALEATFTSGILKSDFQSRAMRRSMSSEHLPAFGVELPITVPVRSFAVAVGELVRL
jgi:hypothetical protein